MLEWLRQAGTRRPAKAPRPPAKRAAPAPATKQIVVGGRTLPLVVRRLANARQISLRLAAAGSAVRVTIPRWGRIAEAEAFARSKADWLAAHLAAIPVHAPIGPGGTVPYRGAPLRIEWAADAPR